VAASSSPEIVIFLPPVISLFESVIIALLAITVPAVIPSTRFNSAAVDVTFVPPISKVVTDNSPATVAMPSASVIKSVSSVWPIVAPLTMTLSTVKVVNVPNEVILDWAAPVTVQLYQKYYL